ncbi:threonine synthase [Streptomyces sp. NPDC001635]
MMSAEMLRYEELMERYRGVARAEKLIKLCCLLCGTEFADPHRHHCAQCSGALDTIYDLDQVKRGGFPHTPNPLMRYFGLLPLQHPENLLWFGEGNTPCYRLARITGELGLGALYVKDESFNPTRSTKDRNAAVGLSRLRELGITRTVMCSTGNNSTAYTRAVQLVAGSEVDVFTGVTFAARWNVPEHPRTRMHLVEGTAVDAEAAAKKYAQRIGIYHEGGFFNASRREGAKLAYLEAFDAMPCTPDYIFQAVSSGLGLLGAYKGALEYLLLGRISHLPRMMAVQEESCAPMARAFAAGAAQIREEDIVTQPVGLAEAILRGNPSESYPYIRSLCLASGGAITSVPSAALREARRMLEDLEGVRVCYSSATALAGAVAAVGEGTIPPGATVLVNLTGADRPTAMTPQNTAPFATAPR